MADTAVGTASQRTPSLRYRLSLMIGLILSYFGYAKIPIETLKLIVAVRHRLSQPNPNMKDIDNVLEAIETLLRSELKLRKV